MNEAKQSKRFFLCSKINVIVVTLIRIGGCCVFYSTSDCLLWASSGTPSEAQRLIGYLSWFQSVCEVCSHHGAWVVNAVGHQKMRDAHVHVQCLTFSF